MNNIDEIESILAECLKAISPINSFNLENGCEKNSRFIIQDKEEITVKDNKLILELIYSNPELDPDDYNKAFRQMYLKHLVNDTYENIEMEILFYVSNIIENSKKIIGIEDKESWTLIFQTTREYICSNQNFYSILEPSFLIDEKAKGKAMKELSKQGYKFDVLNSEIVFLEDGYKRIFNEIENRIKEIGGINFLEYLLNALNLKIGFNKTYNQYIFSRKHEIHSEYEGMIPWNYLFKIGVKNFQRKNYPIANKRKTYKKTLNVIETSIKLGIVLNLQNSNPYYHLFITPKNVPLYLRNNIILDNVFFLPQFNIDFIEQILIKMIRPIFKDYNLNKKLGFDFDNYVNVMNYLLNRANENKMTYINFSNLKKDLDITKRELSHILKVISIENKKVNSSYLYLHDEENTFIYPIIKTSNSTGYMLLPSIAAYSFYETISNTIRRYVKNCDQLLGKNLEEVISSSLSAKNINYITGFYGDNEECDLIIEDKNTIVFIEIKKKILTSISKKGNDTSAFYDLSKSLLASQRQILKHEINLVSNNFLELRENRSPKISKRGKVVKLDYNNRRILKISLSSHEYGFLNDSQIVTSLLENLSYAEVGTKHEELNEHFEKFKDELNRFQKTLLEGLRKNALEERPFFNSNFISLQQLLFIIRDSNNSEELIKKLSHLNFITNGTASFYTNYASIN